MVPGATSSHWAWTFSPTISKNLPEVNITVPVLTSPDRYWNPVRRAASSSAAKTSDGLARKVIDRELSLLFVTGLLRGGCLPGGLLLGFGLLGCSLDVIRRHLVDRPFHDCIGQ